MRPAHPAPLVAARPAHDAEIPRNPASLLRRAHALGWDASATYAHGISTDAQGGPTHPVESLVVRLTGPERAVVGVWHDGGFTSGYVLGRGVAPTPVGWRALSAAVAESGSGDEQPKYAA